MPSFSQSIVAVNVSAPGSENAAVRLKEFPLTTKPPLTESTVGATLTTVIWRVSQVVSSSSVMHNRTS